MKEGPTWEERHNAANDAYSYRKLYRQEGQDMANSMHRYTKERLLGIYGSNNKTECYDEWTDVITER